MKNREYRGVTVEDDLRAAEPGLEVGFVADANQAWSPDAFANELQ
jgi:hypothetical protein